jgi:hypothetical protein
MRLTEDARALAERELAQALEEIRNMKIAHHRALTSAREAEKEQRQGGPGVLR